MHRIRRLRDWVPSWAHPHRGTITLACFPSTESIPFSLSPNPLPMAMSFSRPARAFLAAPLIRRFGRPIRTVIGRCFNLPAGVSALLPAGGFVLPKRAF